jgi:hypothetical protein
MPTVDEDAVDIEKDFHFLAALQGQPNQTQSSAGPILCGAGAPWLGFAPP